MTAKAAPTVLNSGQITADNAAVVLSSLLSQADNTVDLSAVNHCDSAGIAVLLEVKKQLAQQQRQVVFVNPSPQLQDLADFLKVSPLLFS